MNFSLREKNHLPQSSNNVLWSQTLDDWAVCFTHSLIFITENTNVWYCLIIAAPPNEDESRVFLPVYPVAELNKVNLHQPKVKICC